MSVDTAGRVVVIDDDPDILDAFGALLQLEGFDYATYRAAAAYLQALDQEQAVPGPSCVVCDVKMPEIDGLQLQSHLKNMGEVPVILMSGRSGANEAVSAFRGGAVDFLIKPVEADQLLQAIGRALDLSRQSQSRAVRRSQVSSLLARLSERELEVAHLVARGMTNLGISLELDIARSTVKFHRQRVFSKLDLAGTADLVRLLQEHESH